jgi:hypothetical protein
LYDLRKQKKRDIVVLPLNQTHKLRSLFATGNIETVRLTMIAIRNQFHRRADLLLLLFLFFAKTLLSPGGRLNTMGAVQAQSDTPRFNEARFSEMVDKVEADALELARKVAELYVDRCEATLLADCYQGNYDHCLSLYPQETCPGGSDFNTPECGDDETCSVLYSFSVSSVSLPLDSVDFVTRSPMDPQVIETVCFTKALDQYFVQKRARDEAFWSEIGFQPNFM